MTDLDKLIAPKEMKAQILPLVIWPDNRLQQQCKDVTVFDDWLEQTAINMFATLRANDGVGLAAPQVGIMINAIAIWIESNKPMFLINPEIVETNDRFFTWEEGCLSVPGYFEDRKRPEHIVVRYQDLTGESHEFEFRDLYAFAIQHEIDHLHGKVFVDNVSPIKKLRIKNKIKKTLKKQKPLSSAGSDFILLQ